MQLTHFLEVEPFTVPRRQSWAVFTECELCVSDIATHVALIQVIVI